MSPKQQKARQQEISKAYYEANREEILERARVKRRDPVAGEEKRRRERERIAVLSPEERERRAQLNRDWYRRNPRPPEENTRAHLKHRYGLTIEDRQRMLENQGGCCYLCGDPLDLSQPRTVHTDHDRSCCGGSRSCGKCVRGLSCGHCNRGIGMFGDDPERIRRAADALEAANARVRARSRSA